MHLFQVGEVRRGDVADIVGRADRQARIIQKRLLDRNLLESDTPKGLLRLGFPGEIRSIWFPKLYPDGVDSLLH